MQNIAAAVSSISSATAPVLKSSFFYRGQTGLSVLIHRYLSNQFRAVHTPSDHENTGLTEKSVRNTAVVRIPVIDRRSGIGRKQRAGLGRRETS